MELFKCEKCDGNEVEEVMGGVTEYSVITGVEMFDGVAEFEYGDTSTDGGDIDTIYFQCANCGHPAIFDNEEEVFLSQCYEGKDYK